VVSGGEVPINRTTAPGELVEPRVDSFCFPSVGDALRPWPVRNVAEDNSKTNGEERFFLASGSTRGDVPALGRECASEAEAIIDAFRERVNFYRVAEFPTWADVAPSGEPILRKDGQKKNNPAS
jgi:hypothetical protein